MAIAILNFFWCHCTAVEIYCLVERQRMFEVVKPHKAQVLNIFSSIEQLIKSTSSCDLGKVYSNQTP